MKAIELLKHLSKEYLSWYSWYVVDGALLAGDGYADFLPVEKDPILWSYFKEHLTYFVYLGKDGDFFAFLPYPDISIPVKDTDDERIFIWILEE